MNKTKKIDKQKKQISNNEFIVDENFNKKLKGIELKYPEVFSAEEMLKSKSVKTNMRNAFGKKEAKDWAKLYHAKTKNYKKNTYFSIKNFDELVSNFYGKALYLSKESHLFPKYFDPENEEPKIVKYIGEPKWLDLMVYDKAQEFKKLINKYYKIELNNSCDIGGIVISNGYDGIRYYDSEATGESFVLYNISKVNMV